MDPNTAEAKSVSRTQTDVPLTKFEKARLKRLEKEKAQEEKKSEPSKYEKMWNERKSTFLDKVNDPTVHRTVPQVTKARINPFSDPRTARRDMILSSRKASELRFTPKKKLMRTADEIVGIIETTTRKRKIRNKVYKDECHATTKARQLQRNAARRNKILQASPNEGKISVKTSTPSYRANRRKKKFEKKLLASKSSHTPADKRAHRAMKKRNKESKKNRKIAGRKARKSKDSKAKKLPVAKQAKKRKSVKKDDGPLDISLDYKSIFGPTYKSDMAALPWFDETKSDMATKHIQTESGELGFADTSCYDEGSSSGEDVVEFVSNGVFENEKEFLDFCRANDVDTARMMIVEDLPASLRPMKNILQRSRSRAAGAIRRASRKITDLSVSFGGNLVKAQRFVEEKLKEADRGIHFKKEEAKVYIKKKAKDLENATEYAAEYVDCVTAPVRKHMFEYVENVYETDSVHLPTPFGQSIFGNTWLDAIYSRFKDTIHDHKSLISIILYLHQMANSPSLAMDMSITSSFWLNTTNTQYATAYTGIAMFYRLMRNRRYALKKKIADIHTEALSDYIKDASGVCKMFLESDVVKALRNLVLTAVSFKFFDLDVSKQIWRFFGKPEKSLSVPDAITSVLDSISQLIGMSEAIINRVPLSEVFLTKDPVGSALIQARKLLVYEDMLYYGLPHKDKDGTLVRREAKEYMKELVPLLEILQAAYPKLNPLTARSEEVNSIIMRLQRSKSIVGCKLEKGTRIAPIAVLVHGAPGIGKSSILNFIYQLHAYVKGRTFDPSMVYHRVATSQFWDGYDPYCTPYVHFSEIGNLSATLASRSGDPLVTELTSLVDVEPHQVDMAYEGKNGAFGKGNTYCMCELLVGDTNNPGMNLKHLVTSVAAVERRFIYIEPIVKPEFKVEGTVSLDNSIPSENFYDKWLFCVKTRRAVSNDKSVEQILLDGNDEKSNIYGLEKLLIDLFKESISHGEMMMEKRNELYEFGNLEECDSKSYEEEAVSSEAGVLQDRIVPEIWRFLVYLFVSALYVGTFLGDASVAAFSLFQCLVVDVYENANYDVSRNIKIRAWVFIGGFVMLIAWILGYFEIFLILLWCVFGSLHVTEIADGMIHRRVEHNYGAVRATGMRAINSLRSFFSYTTGNQRLWINNNKHYLISAIAVAVSVLTIYKMVRKDEEDEEIATKTESSNFIRRDKENVALEEVEDFYGCGKSYERFNVNNTNTYNVMTCAPSVHTSSLSDLNTLVMCNVRSCRVHLKNTTLITYCIGVKGSFALINRHAFGKDDEVLLEVSQTGGLRHDGEKFLKSRIRVADCVLVVPDVYLVSLTAIAFRNIIKHFPQDDMKFKNAESLIGTARVVSSRYADSLSVYDQFCGEIEFGPTISYDWTEHSKGDCGLPVVATRDRGSCIVGLHSAGTKSSDSYGVVVLRNQITRAVKELSKRVPFTVMSEAKAICGTLPHSKSPVRYEELGPVQYFGKVSQPNMNQSSSLRKSIFFDSLENMFCLNLSFVRTVKYGPPMMQPAMKNGVWVSPYNVFLRKVNKQKKVLYQGRVNRAIDIVIDKVKSNLDLRGIPSLNPLLVKAAVNGIRSDAFIRRLDMTKAAGYGTPGKKQDYAIRYIDEPGLPPTYDELDPSIVQEILRIIGCYERGENAGPVFKAQLKDEPRSLEKVASGKTRVFFATPFAFLVVQRMFLAPLYSLMLEFSEDFYTAIGIDMHRDAHMLYDRITEFSPNILEGDYGGYDCSMPFEIGVGANAIILALLQHLGYSNEQLLVTSGVLSDLLFPSVEMIGEMLRIPGLQPSGKYGTAEDNSIRNLLIMVYMWLSVDECEKSDFFANVLPVSYGDDVLAAVKDDYAPYFNAISFSEMCESATNMTFTTATKGAVTHKFTTAEWMTFLKRSFRYHSALDRIVAPLSLDSIYKTLEWISPSQMVNEPTQMEQICVSSLRELFFHTDASCYAKIRVYLISGLRENYPGVQFALPTFEEILESLKGCPVAMPVPGGGQEPSIEFVSTESGVFNECKCGWDCTCGNDQVSDTTIYAFGRAYVGDQWSANRMNDIRTQIGLLQEEYNESVRLLDEMKDPMPGYTYRQVKQTPLYCSDDEFRNYVDEYHSLLSHTESLLLSVRRLRQWAAREGGLITTESAVEGDQTSGAIDAATEVVHENITDIGGDEEDMEMYPSYEQLAVGQAGSLQMSNFLERPIALLKTQLVPGTDVSLKIDLWNNFLLAPSVRAKLRNYAFLRANMNVRITLSGTPFHYGKVLISYQPLAGLNRNLKLPGFNTTFRPEALTYLSQSPYAKVMDVKANQPLEMSFPFISPQPMLRLFNSSSLVLSAATPYADAIDFGHLFLYTLNQVGCASETPTNVSVFVYAWMTDVEVGAPTGTVLEITTEADERKSGPIESIASRASEIAYALTSVPSISPFAKASGMALEGIGSLAALFGFSVPTMNNEPIRVKNMAFQNGAQTVGYDTGKRVTLDPKQELSIDPRCVAIDDDQMSIAAICARECLLDSFSWTTANTSLGTSIWTIPINPRIGGSSTYAAGKLLRAPTPLAFAATPFEYWRGDLTYRFEIVCSKFHRGKLAFYYEPNVAQRSQIDSVLDMNKQYIKIVDIQETQDITFTVKWAFPRPWARVMTSAMVSQLGAPSVIVKELFEYANGYIGVVPFTTLQSPTESSDVISINVYIMSDNIMFNHMCSNHMPLVRPEIVTESGRLSAEEITEMDLNESSANLDYVSEECFGELPVSFRSLLKRFAIARAVSAGSVTGDSSLVSIIGTMPIYPAIIPDYDDVTNTITPNLYSYLRYAYIGIRGGMRHRISFRGNVTTAPMSGLVVTLGRPSETALAVSTAFDGSLDATSSTMDGSIRFVPSTNGGVEFELPVYTNNIFGVSFNGDPYPVSSSIINHRLSREFHFALTKTANAAAYVIDDFSTAEDFSLFGFQGAPFYVYDGVLP